MLGRQNFRVLHEPHPKDQSSALRAPEVEIGAGWDEQCDTWSMGCNVRVIDFLPTRILFLM